MTIFGDRIYTVRLQLRRIETGDLDLLVRWSNDPNAHGPCLTPEAASYDRVAEQHAGGVFWSSQNRLFIIELRDGTPLGTIHYWIPSEQPEKAVMAIKVAAADQRGKGYGTEAQKYLIMFLFDRTAITDIEMYTDINNFAQQRCLEKLGFELVDARRYLDQQVQRTGYLYRLTKAQYNAHSMYQFHYA